MHPLCVHHIGHAVTNLDAAIDTYERLLGATLEHREVVPDQGVEAASLHLGDSRIELLAPLGADTPVGRFLEKRGPGMHHVASRWTTFAGRTAEAAGAGAELIDEDRGSGLSGSRCVHPPAERRRSAGGTGVPIENWRTWSAYRWLTTWTRIEGWALTVGP